MRGVPPDAAAIRKETERLLLAAGVSASGRLPTPIDDILAAANLSEPKESLLSDSVLRQAPAHLRRAMRKLRFKIEALLDRKTREVHIDPAIQTRGRAAFKRLHEVTHDILPWQRALAYADDQATLSWDANRRFEWQANYGAAELLFQGRLLADVAADYEIGLASINELANLFGSSIHACLRRCVESHAGTVAGVVLQLSPSSAEPLAFRRRETFCSQRWITTFGEVHGWPEVLRSPPYGFIDLAHTAQPRDPTVCGEWRFPDLQNRTTELCVEVRNNSYNLLVLLWKPSRRIGLHRRHIAD